MDVSPLGLVEMTRQNVTDGVREILTRTCPTCVGEGVIQSEETMAIEVIRRLRELAAEHGLAELSMGTTQDYRVAAEEGATFVRVGSVLFRD
jgi:Ribonuclease G/E